MACGVDRAAGDACSTQPASSPGSSAPHPIAAFTVRRLISAALALLSAAIIAVPLGASPSESATASTRFAPLIFGGTAAAPGALPFVVYIVARVGTGGYVCTGSVIAPNAILTAAHCTHDPNTGAPVPASAFTVIAKAVTLSPLDAGAEQLSVSAVHAYQPAATDLLGDVAVLLLATPTTATPVQLATTADSALYAPSTPVVVTGWGQTAVDAPPSSVLERGTQTLAANFSCAANRRFIPAVQLCTSAPGFRPAVCHGDSGGPLLASGAQGLVEIGVASYSSGATCGTDPDYFARVAPLQGWIASQVTGTPPPPAYDPPLVGPPSVDVRLVKDSTVVRFPAASSDPATLLEGYTIVLRNASGRTIEKESLDTGTFGWSFTELKPGTYKATVTADYTAGSSSEAVSTPVTLAMPANTKPPSIGGRAVPGGRLTCRRGLWKWPGSSTFVERWLRNGVYAGPPSQPATGYAVLPTDAGKRISCRVTLTTPTGAKATAVSRPVEVRPR
jgi:trypsin